ncbi:Calvin cycle protein CP12 [Raphidiopsis sp. BLCC-F218]
MTNTQEKSTSIQEKIEQEVQQAREVCDISGGNSAACAAAWDAVEELQAAASHKKQEKPKTSLQAYCDANPDADECRVYED